MKFSIVSPTFNMELWVAKTIESIISQEGDFEIEYIFADGGSTDTTFAIFQEYKRMVEEGAWSIKCRGISMTGFSEKDRGTFDAINKGFARVTGDICTWADGDNTFEPGAFQAIASAFEAFPEIQWITAFGNTMNNRWEKVRPGICQLYRQDWLRSGIYGREAYFVEQNGCFWRTELLRKVGPIPTDFKVAGDYWFWMQMARYAAPVSLNVSVSNFMRRDGQLHIGNTYKNEQQMIRPYRNWRGWIARMFFWPYYHVPTSWRPLFESLYPICFPFHAPEYIEIKDGVPTKHVARSFVVR